jgi:tripartite motif-containing protein 71
MTTPEPEPELGPEPTPESIPTPSVDPEVQQAVYEQVQDERKRRVLLFLLLLLLLMLACVGYLIFRYLTRPQPLPELLPDVISQNINYPPVYQFSIPDLDRPIGVAVSPDEQRIYVTESAGDRLIKMFDRDGNLVLSFSPPGTNPTTRIPSYIAVDASGRVYVSDQYHHVINIFDADGNFLDSMIGKDTMLSEEVAALNDGNLPAGTQFYYSFLDRNIYYQLPDQPQQSKHYQLKDWIPMGLRFDQAGNLMVTNLVDGKHSVLIIPAASLNGSWLEFNPDIAQFGEEGSGDGQLSFPNSVVTDSKGNFYVSDGNNGRISAWTADMKYDTFFGFGSTEGSLNLPRGAWMSSKDHLHVADAVGQFVRVYDVSGEEPTFIYNFGDFGIEDGKFNYPTDIAMDSTGRVYVTDRENNRVQIWSY